MHTFIQSQNRFEFFRNYYHSCIEKKKFIISVLIATIRYKGFCLSTLGSMVLVYLYSSSTYNRAILAAFTYSLQFYVLRKRSQQIRFGILFCCFPMQTGIIRSRSGSRASLISFAATLYGYLYINQSCNITFQFFSTLL